MTTPTSLLFVFSFLTLATTAKAGGAEEKYHSALVSRGYRCTDTPRADGYFCVSDVNGYRTYVTIPKNMQSHTHNLFYAHGLVKVCGNGASGENYLQNESPTLRRLGAIAIMPWRQNAADTSFPLGSFLAKAERDLESEEVPLIVAGHSAAGSFLGAELSANQSVARRVEQALLIDAIYGVERSAGLWNNVLSINPSMKVKLVSSTTMENSRAWMSILKPKYPQSVSLEQKPEGHCEMPKYFNLLGSSP